jgi:hypothetical protein
VATDWGPAVQTGIGAAAAIAGGFLGAWMHGRIQQRAERQQRRERAAEVLAEVATILDDLEISSRTSRTRATTPRSWMS